MDTNSVLKWFAGVGAVLVSASIVGTFNTLLQIEKNVIELQTKQSSIVSSANNINKSIDKIDDRLRELEKSRQ